MGLQPEDHIQLNVYLIIMLRLQRCDHPTFPELFQMVQDYERELDERHERLGKKAPKTILVNALYSTPSEEKIPVPIIVPLELVQSACIFTLKELPYLS